MKGTRPLTKEEVSQVQELFLGQDQKRNYALFTLGYYSGLRASELLSLKVEDVIQHGKPRKHVHVSRTHVKGKKHGREVIFHPAAQEAIQLWLTEHPCPEPKSPLFVCLKGRHKALSYKTAWVIYKSAFETLQLEGSLATHSTRKAFCDRVYKNYKHDLVKTQKALGHTSILTTVKYVSFLEEDVERGIPEM